MGYKYLSTELKDSTVIAKGSNLSTAISFQMSDYIDPNTGKPYYTGDTYTNRYVKYLPGILADKWANIYATDDFKYKSGNTTYCIPFAAQTSCPMFYRYAETSRWGDLRKEGPATIYLSYRNEAVTSNSTTGIWYSENNTTWTLKKTGHSVCFIELVAGGGGGGGCYCACDGWATGGGGGGGGGYACMALDLSLTGKVTITIGSGGKEGASNTTVQKVEAGSAGGSSILTTTSGITITCSGGGGAAKASGGVGGTVTNSLGELEADSPTKGLLKTQVYYGKAGGNGRCHSTAVSEGSPGGGFVATDVLTSFGIFATNTAVVKAGYHGYSGSMYNPYTNWNTPLGGGGAGASALGGGYHSDYSGSHHGYGGGGNGAACGIKDAVAAWNDDGEYDSAGCSGANGCCIIHYSYRSV